MTDGFTWDFGGVVERLTLTVAREVGPGLVALDRQASSRYGLDFADDVWEEAAFLADRPGKWTYSRLVRNQEGRAVAFWIASRADSPLVGVYSHRTVVDPDHRLPGLHFAMWRSVLAEARARGEAGLSHSVSVTHPGLNRFYPREGCVRLEGEALSRFATAKGLTCEVLHDRVREPGGHEKHIYWLPLSHT